MSDCPCRQELMERINEASFAVDEVKLYLNTHPCDEEALEYFAKYSRIRNEALQEYAAHFSPLTIDTVIYSGKNEWNWIDEPWPWEGEC